MLKKMTMFAVVAGLVLTLAPAAHAELYVYEPFDYDAGTHATGQAGALGMGVSSWADGGFIKEPTKAYADGAGENLAVNGRYMEVGGPDGGGQPLMRLDMAAWNPIYKTEVGGEGTGDFQLGAPGGTFWMSFWRQCSAIPPDPNHWYEDIAISGVLLGRYYWNQRIGVIYGGGGQTSVFGNEEAFCVVRHTTDALGETTIDMWVNPPLVDEGALETTFPGDRRSTGHYTNQRFKDIRFRFAGGSERWGDYDEIRMGELYGDVAPFDLVAPTSSLRWQAGSGLWGNSNWTDDVTPDLAPTGDTAMTIDVAASVVTVDADFIGGVDGPAFSVAVGENNTSELIIDPLITLEVSRPVTIGASGKLSVNGTLNALYMNSSGDVDFNAGSAGTTPGDLKILAGTADFALGSTINAASLQNAGTVNANGALNALIYNTGTFTAGGGSTITATNLTNFNVFNTGGTLIATNVNNAGTFTVTGGSVTATDLVNSGTFAAGGNPITVTNVRTSGAFTASGLLGITTMISSGATDLTGSSGAIATMNVTGGTTTLASAATITQLNSSGGTTELTSSTVTRVTATGGILNVNGAGNTITNLNVGGAEVNTNAAVSAGGLRISGGQLNLGGAMSVATAALIGGTVDAAINPLVISGEMKLAGGITATYTPGGGATSFTVSGADIVDNSIARTITLSGGELAFSTTAAEAGLDIRAWQDGEADDPLEGTRFSMTAPTPAPDHSTIMGTIGYATESINMGGSDVEHFSTDGNNSGVPDSDPLRPTGYLNNYNVEYRGLLYIEMDGDYQFATNSDDGSALWIDPASDNPEYSTANVQNVGSHGMTTRDSGVINLTEGYHDIIVRQCEGGGGNGVQVLWDPTGGTNWSAIPGVNFFHGSGGDILAIDMPNTSIVATAPSTLAMTSEVGKPVTLGGIEVADSATLTIASDATDIQLSNLTLGGGSMVKSTAVATANVTITVDGKLSAGNGVSSLGAEGEANDTNLTLATGASFDWTFTRGGAEVGEWAGDRVFVNGALDMADGLEIHLVDGGGSSGVGGVDVVLFEIFAGGAPFNAGQINIDAPGLGDWTWGELEYVNDQYVVLNGLVTGAVVAPHAGDANGDDKVDHLDLGLFNEQFGLKGSGLICDFNNDDVVGIDDLAILRANFGWVLPTAPGAASSPTGTPEPATMSLLAIGGLLVIRRRKHR